MSSRCDPVVVYLIIASFLTGALWAVQRPQGFLVLLFVQAGLSETQAGLASACGLISPIFGGPLMGLIADALPKRQRHHVLIAAATIRAGVQLLAWPVLLKTGRNVGPWAATTLVALWTFCNSGGILTEMTMLTVGTAGFGRVRLWGGIGFATGSLATGITAQLDPALGLQIVFLESVVITMCFVFAAWRIARLSGMANPGSTSNCVSQTSSGPISSISRLLSVQGMSLFLSVVLALGVGEGVMNDFTYFRVEELPFGSSTVMGLSAVCMIISEVPFFYYSGPLVARFGVFLILTGALFCMAIRQLWIASLWDARWLLPGELLHGITFSIANSAAVIHIREIAPEDLRNTAQSMLNAIFVGFGQGSAGLIGGEIMRHYSSVALFRCSALFCLLATSLPLVLLLQSRRGGDMSIPEQQAASTVSLQPQEREYQA